ncbi:MAG: PEP-CTERM/exosortase system-associated acyltransferase [Nitrospiria bacterium]
MNLTESFNHHFQIVTPNSDKLMQEAMHLRYMVYCVENTLAEPKDHPSHIETDRYDRHSVHRLIQHKRTGVLVGYVRLILSSSIGRWNRLPIEENFNRVFYKDALKSVQLKRKSLSEISRFIVSKRRLQRITNRHLRDSDKKDTGPLFLPPVALGLFKAIFNMAMEKNVVHSYACLEPPLLRLLKRFGIVFKPIGPIVDYHGKRLPCFRSIVSLLSGIYLSRPDIWRFIIQDSHGQDSHGVYLNDDGKPYWFREVS